MIDNSIIIMIATQRIMFELPMTSVRDAAVL